MIELPKACCIFLHRNRSQQLMIYTNEKILHVKEDLFYDGIRMHLLKLSDVNLKVFKHTAMFHYGNHSVIHFALENNLQILYETIDGKSHFNSEDELLRAKVLL